jgi:hypothetical protein
MSIRKDELVIINYMENIAKTLEIRNCKRGMWDKKPGANVENIGSPLLFRNHLYVSATNIKSCKS